MSFKLFYKKKTQAQKTDEQPYAITTAKSADRPRPTGHSPALLHC